MKLSSFRYLCPQTLKSMKGNGWMTFAAILTIAISLFLCAFFWMIITNLDATATEVEENVRIMAYLDFDQEQSDYDHIGAAIRVMDGVAKVEFISKEDGIENLAQRFNDADLIESLGGNNPLPDAYSITAESPEDVQNIYNELVKMDGIYEVTYGAGTVEKLFALTSTLRKAGIVVMALLGIAAIVLIAMAIRLTILARKKEVMVMKWCGATDAFVRWPFFLEGILLGLIGAIIALILALLLYARAAGYMADTVSFLTILPLKEIWGNVTLFTLGAGIVLGAIGSLIPLTRCL
ncbi:MAG: permease-like cell division protein FtsX, partial [Firmicutes bacterium]|nr:permease-like cell division protein FtsX [Bacillota bacterium]